MQRARDLHSQLLASERTNVQLQVPPTDCTAASSQLLFAQSCAAGSSRFCPGARTSAGKSEQSRDEIVCWKQVHVCLLNMHCTRVTSRVSRIEFQL
jgi:hypothetical protein